MRGRGQRDEAWNDEEAYGGARGAQGHGRRSSGGGRYNEDDGYGDYARRGASHYGADAYGADAYGADGYDDEPYGMDDEQGLVLQQEQSLVNVSTTIAEHGVPLLSYTRTMNRFYTNRKQRISLGRYTCEVCGERIRFWAYETPNGNRTHDGCYERLAWMWTNLYAQQQRLAAEGQLE